MVHSLILNNFENKICYNIILQVNPNFIAQLNQAKKSRSYTALEESTIMNLTTTGNPIPDIMNVTTTGNQALNSCFSECDATGGIYDPINRSCQCDFLCYAYGNCCADYIEYCATEVPADYLWLTIYNDDQCMEYSEDTFIKDGHCVPIEDDFGAYYLNAKSVSFLGQPPVISYYALEDTKCKGAVVASGPFDAGCSFGTRATSINKATFEQLTYGGFINM